METSISKCGNEYGLDVFSEDGQYGGWLCEAEVEELLLKIKELNSKPKADQKIISAKSRFSQNHSGLRVIGNCRCCKKDIKTFNKEAIKMVDYRIVDGEIRCMRC